MTSPAPPETSTGASTVRLLPPRYLQSRAQSSPPQTSTPEGTVTASGKTSAQA